MASMQHVDNNSLKAMHFQKKRMGKGGGWTLHELSWKRFQQNAPQLFILMSAQDFSFEGMEKKEDYLLLKKSSRHIQAELFVEILS
jgi:hypothetical protein